MEQLSSKPEIYLFIIIVLVVLPPKYLYFLQSGCYDLYLLIGCAGRHTFTRSKT